MFRGRFPTTATLAAKAKGAVFNESAQQTISIRSDKAYALMIVADELVKIDLVTNQLTREAFFSSKGADYGFVDLRAKVPHLVACGFNHDVVVTADNEVYMRGGIKVDWAGNESAMYPDWCKQPTSNLSEIVKLAAGYEHTVIATEAGKVYGYGSNKFFQQGKHEQQVPGCEQFAEIHFSEPGQVSHLLAGPYFTLAVFENKRAQIWGYLEASETIRTQKTILSEKLGSEAFGHVAISALDYNLHAKNIANNLAYLGSAYDLQIGLTKKNELLIAAGVGIGLLSPEANPSTVFELALDPSKKIVSIVGAKECILCVNEHGEVIRYDYQSTEGITHVHETKLVAEGEQPVTKRIDLNLTRYANTHSKNGYGEPAGPYGSQQPKGPNLALRPAPAPSAPTAADIFAAQSAMPTPSAPTAADIFAAQSAMPVPSAPTPSAPPASVAFIPRLQKIWNGLQQCLRPESSKVKSEFEAFRKILLSLNYTEVKTTLTQLKDKHANNRLLSGALNRIKALLIEHRIINEDLDMILEDMDAYIKVSKNTDKQNKMRALYTLLIQRNYYLAKDNINQLLADRQFCRGIKSRAKDLVLQCNAILTDRQLMPAF
jgi:hypothetical protein